MPDPATPPLPTSNIPTTPPPVPRDAPGHEGRSVDNAKLNAKELFGELDNDDHSRDEHAPETEAEHHPPTGDGTFPCNNCGADLRFKPGLRSLACEYCGHANPIPQSEDDVRELDFNHYMQRLIEEGRDGRGNATETEDHDVLLCQTCGAQPEADRAVTSSECPFCGSAIVTQSATKRLLKPNAVLPFAVERKQARQLFRDWINSRRFAPNTLRRAARLDETLQGVYVPHWTFDARTITVYRGKKGVTRTTGTGKNRRTYTRWYPVSGTILHAFDDVLVRASKSLPQKQADELEPWDLHNLRPYDDSYLAGFRAEAYAVDLPEGWGRARLAMDGVLRSMVKREIGGDRQKITAMKTEHRRVTFKHILLPVWISAYRYRDETYRFLINARTGEVQGERPWSWWKIALAVLVGLLVLGALFLMINGSGLVSDGTIDAG